jgi:hypothetical protein
MRMPMDFLNPCTSAPFKAQKSPFIRSTQSWESRGARFRFIGKKVFFLGAASSREPVAAGCRSCIKG